MPVKTPRKKGINMYRILAKSHGCVTGILIHKCLFNAGEDRNLSLLGRAVMEGVESNKKYSKEMYGRAK
jgi:hypothetical protein